MQELHQFNNEKFKKLREYLKLTQLEFANQLNTRQQTINMIERNKRAVPKSIIEAFVKKYKIDYYKALLCQTEEELKIVLNNQVDNSNVVAIPFYKVGASAGEGITLPETSEQETLNFDARWIRDILGAKPNNLHLIYAKGDSMDSGFNTTSDIKDGNLLMVDTSKTEGNGKTYVILVNNQELRVKKLVKNFDGTLNIISNNPKYKDEIYKPDDKEIEIKVIGRVIWNGSKETI